MAFFNTDAPRAGEPATPQVTLLAEGARLEGTLEAAQDVRVAGHVVGRVRAGGRIIIAASGQVEGDLEAVGAEVAGTVLGDVTVSERLVLRPTARLEGHVVAGRLIIEEGAVFNGDCRTGAIPPPVIEHGAADAEGALANGRVIVPAA